MEEINDGQEFRMWTWRLLIEDGHKGRGSGHSGETEDEIESIHTPIWILASRATETENICTVKEIIHSKFGR